MRKLDFSHLAAYHIASVRRSLKVLATFCGSLTETNPQKVALEERSLQLFGEAFLEKWGEGAKAVSAWSGRGKLLDQRILGIGTSSVSIPFDGKWLNSR
jgi:hypothetical protein